MDVAPPTSAAQTAVAPFFPHPRSVETLARCMETSPVADASLPSSLAAGGGGSPACGLKRKTQF